MQTLYEILTESRSRVLRLLAIFACLLASTMVWLGQRLADADFVYLLTILPWYCWVSLFLCRAVFCWIDMVVRNPRFVTSKLGALLGIWLWSMVIVSGAKLMPLDTMSILYLLPMLIEALVLGGLFFEACDE